MNLLQPKKRTYRKSFLPSLKNTETSGIVLNQGEFGLKALEPVRLTARQIESARRSIRREMARAGILWTRIFPQIPMSRKPIETRMGSGKGSVEGWICAIKPGRILFEVAGISKEIAERALSYGAAKLPIKTKFIAREAVYE